MKTTEQKLEVLSTLRGYLNGIEGKGVKGLEINNSFILGYEQCLEHIEGMLHDNLV